MLGTGDTRELRAPAKINLFLEVLGRRADGYHDIRSLVVPISLFDTVRLERSSAGVETEVEFATEADAESMGSLKPEDNLATRAALALKKETGSRAGARIRIGKRIPVGGGLGGGSADAAATLVGLNSLWETGLSNDQLGRIGSSLGCDIPAMIEGAAVLVEGLGEQVKRLKPTNGHSGGDLSASAWWMVLANPGFPVSTRDIYARWQKPLTSAGIPITRIISAFLEGDLDVVGRGLFNGLQETVFRKYPLIEMVAEALKKAGAVGVAVSGSGASVFGLARDRAHAQEIERIAGQALGASADCRSVRLLPDGVMAAHGPLEA